MFVADVRKTVPLHADRLDWDAARILSEEEVLVPCHDERLLEWVRPFAYDIAQRRPWAWPDYSRTTVCLALVLRDPHVRAFLRVGVQPAQSADEEVPAEWAAFEAKRLEAVRAHEQNGGSQVHDDFPVMPTEQEESAVRAMLYERLGMY